MAALRPALLADQIRAQRVVRVLARLAERQLHLRAALQFFDIDLDHRLRSAQREELMDRGPEQQQRNDAQHDDGRVDGDVLLREQRQGNDGPREQQRECERLHDLQGPRDVAGEGVAHGSSSTSRMAIGTPCAVCSAIPHPMRSVLRVA